MRHRSLAPIVAACVLWGSITGSLFAQEPTTRAVDETVVDEAVVDPAVTPPGPQLAPPQWVILMAILGEQVPEGVVLTAVAFDVAPADARIRVVLPPAGSAELRALLLERLELYFEDVGVGDAAVATPEYLALEITLTGVPSLEQYRARRPAGAGTAPPYAPAPVRPNAPVPRPATAPVATSTPPAVLRNLQLRRVTAGAAGGGLVAHVVVNGREYIAREGRHFANRRYRFIGSAPSSDASPETQCITIEHVESGSRQAVCTQP